ncbi:MAG: hypothetical protein HY360_12000 [Verrucomicrobia bacterium]|nr:hypothetical protein [Verrucomicrobiota bacterium]
MHKDETSSKEFPLQWKVDNLDERGNLLVEGKPFFPIGLYTCFGIDEASGTHRESRYEEKVTPESIRARLRTIKESGFNLIQTYTMQFYGAKIARPGWHQNQPGDVLENTNPEKIRRGMLKFMDYAQEAGLKVLSGALQPHTIRYPLPKSEAEWAQTKEEIAANVGAWKSHPALAVWYLVEEPYNPNAHTDVPVTFMTDCCQYLKNLDSTRPLFLCSCDFAFPSGPSDKRYRKATDIIGPDPYPIGKGIPIEVITERLDFIRKYQEGTPPMPQIWQVVQIWNAPGGRLPTRDEIRLMALLAMTRDVKGLMFYEMYDYPDKNPDHWLAISEAVRSLQSVIPDALASEDVVKVCQASDKRIQTIMRRIADPNGRPPRYSLIAVNPAQDSAFEAVAVGRVTFDFETREGQPAIVALDENKSGQFQLGSQRKLAVEKNDHGYRFSDEFGGSAAHVYRVTITKERK